MSDRRTDLAVAYAMKFINVSNGEPTDAEIEDICGECVKPPPVELYPEIRAAVEGWRIAAGRLSRMEDAAATREP